jgi:leucyl aminopeptidase
VEFSIKPFESNPALLNVKTGCIAVGVYDNKTLTRSATVLDAGGAITAALASRDISGKAGTTLLLRDIAGIGARRLLLVGLGPAGATTPADFDLALDGVLAVFATLGCADAILALPYEQVRGREAAWGVARTVEFAHRLRYRADAYKSRREPAPAGVRNMAIMAPNVKANRAALSHAMAVADGVQLARTLGDLAPNICTPAYLARTAQRLAKDYGFELEVLERDQLAALNMHAFLAVARGSTEPPRFIVLKHLAGRIKDAPVVLVGKGITFDSGGISIKPAAGMDEMKYDMGGAAAVLGVFRALGELQPKLNVVGVIAACENMPSGSATRPGDIVTAMNGTTIEVLNTDAEGRLILCDALTYVERFKPAAVVDIATLTGACVVALGQHHSGLFTRDDAEHDELAQELLDAGRQANDHAWRLPVEAAHAEQLKSPFADLANLGTPGGGASVAAAFLEHFTRDYTWAHLDNAGTAWKSGADKGATGRPVPLLVHFLLNRLRAA